MEDARGLYDLTADEDDSGRVAAEFLEDTAGAADPACRVCGTPTDEAGTLCDDCADEETDDDADDCDRGLVP
jgi:hypothetical protein